MLWKWFLPWFFTKSTHCLVLLPLHLIPFFFLFSFLIWCLLVGSIGIFMMQRSVAKWHYFGLTVLWNWKGVFKSDLHGGWSLFNGVIHTHTLFALRHVSRLTFGLTWVGLYSKTLNGNSDFINDFYHMLVSTHY